MTEKKKTSKVLDKSRRTSANQTKIATNKAEASALAKHGFKTVKPIKKKEK